MSVSQPWVMAVHADAVGADERDRIARSVQGRIASHDAISAPPALPAAVRARLNGGFLGIDDLYSRTRPIPRGYIDDAARVVATKTQEYDRWLEGGRQTDRPILPTRSR